MSKRMVWEAYKRVKANQGAAGVDEESLADFEGPLTDNLSKLWNRKRSQGGNPCNAQMTPWSIPRVFH
jgi:RNA-directed DNA polymerase